MASLGLRRLVSPEAMAYIERVGARAGVMRAAGISAQELLQSMPAAAQQTTTTRRRRKGAADDDTVPQDLFELYAEEATATTQELGLIQAELLSVNGQLQMAEQDGREESERHEQLAALKREWDSRVSAEGSWQVRQEKALTAELDEHAREAALQRQECAVLEAELESMAEALRVAQEEVSSLEGKLASAAEQRSDAKVTATRAIDAGAESRAELEKHLDALRKRNDELRHQIELANVEIEKRQSRQALIEQHLAKVRADISGLARQMWKQQAKKATSATTAASAASGSKEASAPVGTVTIVFLDVQESQALWEEIPECMTLAQSLENRVVRDRASKNNGYIVKSDGESFMLAFSSARAAAMFCSEVHEAMVHTDWPDALRQHAAAAEVVLEDGTPIYRGLRARMGVNTGNPQVVSNPSTGRADYQGPAVNKAARIAALARGGVTLVSEDSWKSFRDQIDPRRIYSRPVGKVALRGFTQEDALFELVPKTLQRRCTAGAPGAAAVQQQSPEDEQQEQRFARLQEMQEGKASDSETFKTIALALSQREQALDTARQEFSRIQADIDGIGKKLERYRRERAEYRMLLAKEEAARRKSQLHVASCAQERVEKNVVLGRAHENISAIMEQQLAIEGSLQRAVTEKEGSRQLFDEVESRVGARSENRDNPELVSLRSRSKELEERLLAARAERQHQLDRVATLQQRLQAQEEKARKRLEELAESRRQEQVRAAQERAGKMRDKLRQLDLFDTSLESQSAFRLEVVIEDTSESQKQQHQQQQQQRSQKPQPQQPRGSRGRGKKPQPQQPARKQQQGSKRHPAGGGDSSGEATEDAGGQQTARDGNDVEEGEEEEAGGSFVSEFDDLPVPVRTALDELRNQQLTEEEKLAEGVDSDQITDLELEFVRRRAELRAKGLKLALRDARQAKSEWEAELRRLESEGSSPTSTPSRVGSAASTPLQQSERQAIEQQLAAAVAARDAAASRLVEVQQSTEKERAQELSAVRHVSFANLSVLKRAKTTEKTVRESFVGMLENPTASGGAILDVSAGALQQQHQQPRTAQQSSMRSQRGGRTAAVPQGGQQTHRGGVRRAPSMAPLPSSITIEDLGHVPAFDGGAPPPVEIDDLPAIPPSSRTRGQRSRSRGGIPASISFFADELLHEMDTSDELSVRGGFGHSLAPPLESSRGTQHARLEMRTAGPLFQPITFSTTMNIDAIIKVQSILAASRAAAAAAAAVATTTGNTTSRKPAGGAPEQPQQQQQQQPVITLGHASLVAFGRMLSGQWVPNKELVTAGVPANAVFENEYEDIIRKRRQRVLRLKAEAEQAAMRRLSSVSSFAPVAIGANKRSNSYVRRMQAAQAYRATAATAMSAVQAASSQVVYPGVPSSARRGGVATPGSTAGGFSLEVVGKRV